MFRSSVSTLALSTVLIGASILSFSQAKAQEPAKASEQTKTQQQAKTQEPAWVTRSNQYTKMLLDVQLKHSPEGASAQGLAQFDTQITNGTRAEEIAQRRELEAVLAKLKTDELTEKDRNVRQDLEIIQKSFNHQFRQDDYELAHKVQYINASAVIFGGLRVLLTDKIDANRREAAVARLRKYAGVEPGYKPFTDVLKQRILEQMAKPGVIYPSTVEMETQLNRNKSNMDSMSALFRKYQLAGWEDPYARLTIELADYDTWIRSNLIPHGRPNILLQPAEYALSLQGFDIDTPPAQLSAMAHADFTECQAEMAKLATQIAKTHNWTSTDYRDVIRELKKTQITGDAILPLFQQRLKAVEEIVSTHNLATLPSQPVDIRMATAAETTDQPAPHLVAPPLLNNTGQKGEFVLPLNSASSPATVGDKTSVTQYDDFTFDAAAWPLTAHEARPGHELQFDAILNHGVSLARALWAFNSTNVEGWGAYSEFLIYPYEPAEAKLITLQLRLLRDARAYLNAELQSDKVKPAEVYKVLTEDVVLSPAFATEERLRLIYRPPGLANSYFYGYIKLLQMRKETQAALGPKFNPKKFDNFVLSQGLLPFDLLHKAVVEDFIPSQKG